MKALKITLIAIGSLLLVYLIYTLIKKQKKDSVTGVKNSEIEKAAIKSGVPPKKAAVIAEANNSTDTARSMGINSISASLIANGIPVTTDSYSQCVAHNGVITYPCAYGTTIVSNQSELIKA